MKNILYKTAVVFGSLLMLLGQVAVADGGILCPTEQSVAARLGSIDLDHVGLYSEGYAAAVNSDLGTDYIWTVGIVGVVASNDQAALDKIKTALSSGITKISDHPEIGYNPMTKEYKGFCGYTVHIDDKEATVIAYTPPTF